MANIRPPQGLIYHNARLVVKGSSLVALGENLSFDCPGVYKGAVDPGYMQGITCAATAIYQVEAAKPEKVRLQFLFSGQPEVVWTVQKKGLRTVALQLPEKDAIDADVQCSFCPRPALLQSEIEADLPAGKQEIVIAYHQKINFIEYGHGYLSRGRWKQGFRYEIWPILGWKKAADFALDLTIALPAQKNWLGLRSPYELACRGAERRGRNIEERDVPLKRTQSGDRYTFTSRLQQLPAILHCEYRESD